MTRLVVIALLGACASSSYGEEPLPGPDASVMDSGPGGAADSAADSDVNDALVPELCRSQLALFPCSPAEERWLWDGNECIAGLDCMGGGSATENECRSTHLSCGAEPPVEECLPIACPFECGVVCDEGVTRCDCQPSYVLVRHALICSDSDALQWLFTLVPREDAMNIEEGVGELRDGIAAARATIDIGLYADADPFHEPWRVAAGDPRMPISFCRRDGCEFPSDGYLEIETGGAGEVRIDLHLVFGEEEVILAPRWFSVDDLRDGC